MRQQALPAARPSSRTHASRGASLVSGMVGDGRGARGGRRAVAPLLSSPLPPPPASCAAPPALHLLFPLPLPHRAQRVEEMELSMGTLEGAMENISSASDSVNSSLSDRRSQLEGLNGVKSNLTKLRLLMDLPARLQARTTHRAPPPPFHTPRSLRHCSLLTTAHRSPLMA